MDALHNLFAAALVQWGRRPGSQGPWNLPGSQLLALPDVSAAHATAAVDCPMCGTCKGP